MDNNTAWDNFFRSGKISDYLEYKQTKQGQNVPVVGVKIDATQDTRDYSETTQYR